MLSFFFKFSHYILHYFTLSSVKLPDTQATLYVIPIDCVLARFEGTMLGTQFVSRYQTFPTINVSASIRRIFFTCPQKRLYRAFIQASI